MLWIKQNIEMYKHDSFGCEGECDVSTNIKFFYKSYCNFACLNLNRDIVG